MTSKTFKFTISTHGFNDVIDVTQKIKENIEQNGISGGIMCACVSSSTASLMVFEEKDGLKLDISRLLENIVPINKIYQYDVNSEDGNAFAYLRAMFLGNSITLPVIDGKIELNKWQRIVLIDFDNKLQNREIIVSVVY